MFILSHGKSHMAHNLSLYNILGPAISKYDHEMYAFLTYTISIDIGDLNPVEQSLKSEDEFRF